MTTRENNGGRTGSPPGLLQDDSKRLSKWFAGRPDARYRLRETHKLFVHDVDYVRRTEMTHKKVMQQALETAEGIANADWRKWEELASPAEFERWAKSRANFMATALREALAQPDHFADAGKPMAQPEQEPVASSTIGLREMLDLMNEANSSRWEIGFRNIVAILYGPRHAFEITDVVERVRQLAAPPQRQPLTDDEIVKLDKWLEDAPLWRVREFTRAVEAAHDIKEQP